MNTEITPDWAWIEVYRPFDDRIRPQCSDVLADRAQARSRLQFHLDAIPEFAAVAIELRATTDGPGGLLLYYNAGWPYAWAYFPLRGHVDAMAVGISIVVSWRSQSDRILLNRSAWRRRHHVLAFPLA